MAKTPYLTAPVKSSAMPTGVPYIVANEAAERFSFYGMRSILVIFMTKYLLDAHHQPDLLTETQATAWYHFFSSAVYFTPLLGAVISDALLGKYRTIIWLSIVYCLGHLALAIDTTRLGLSIGLGLIAIGSGGIKPCVSAHVGDQFGVENQKLLSRVFSWFYFSLNLGSAVATLLIPYLLASFGPHLAFGTPGLLMLAATWCFWLGRRKFVHVPPSGWKFVKETFSLSGLKTVWRIAVIFLFVAPFWSLYDQASSRWVFQAQQMDRKVFGHEILAAQTQALNPLLVLLYIPLFTYVVYPCLNRFFTLTPLRKISLGLFATAVSFLVPAWVESQLQAGLKPFIGWHLLAYSILIAAEILVSITGLEFAYTQAPKEMKSLVMSLWLLSVSLGNEFTALVNLVIQNPDHSSKLNGVHYYLFFAGVMLLTAIGFIFVAMRYQGRTYIQGEPEGNAANAVQAAAS